MSIEAISSSGGAYAATGLQPSQFKQIKQDFNDLATALQSGDLSGAQQAFASLQQDSPQLARGLNNATDPMGKALGNLASALKSGDLSGAQKAFAALQQVAQGVRHGHHHRADAADLSGGTSGATGTDSDGDNDNSSGSVLNATA